MIFVARISEGWDLKLALGRATANESTLLLHAKNIRQVGGRWPPFRSMVVRTYSASAKPPVEDIRCPPCYRGYSGPKANTCPGHYDIEQHDHDGRRDCSNQHLCPGDKRAHYRFAR